MQWFRFQYDVDERRRVMEVLQQLRRALRDRVGVKALYEDLLKPGAIPTFFAQMFSERGAGNSFYGRSWKPLTPGWIHTKERKRWDPRIGHRKLKLSAGLSDPGSRHNITRVNAQWAEFGAKPSDGKKSYGAYFNALRPVIDGQTMADIKVFLEEGGGLSAFEKAVAKFKLALAWKAVAGQRHSYYGNVYFQ